MVFKTNQPVNWMSWGQWQHFKFLLNFLLEILIMILIHKNWVNSFRTSDTFFQWQKSSIYKNLFFQDKFVVFSYLKYIYGILTHSILREIMDHNFVEVKPLFKRLKFTASMKRIFNVLMLNMEFISLVKQDF